MKLRRRARRVLLPLIAFATGRRKVNFLHIGKTGGTALRVALGIRSDGLLLTPDYIIKFHDHSVRLDDVARGEKIVFGIRDPVARFVSAFYSRLRRGRHGTNSWKPAEREALERFRTPEALALGLSSLNADEKSSAEAAMCSILHVRHGLPYWLSNVAALQARSSDIAYVYHQQTLETDFENLKRLLHLPAELALPTDPVIAHRLPEAFDRKLSEDAAKNIAAWYAADYALIAAGEAIAQTHAQHLPAKAATNLKAVHSY